MGVGRKTALIGRALSATSVAAQHKALDVGSRLAWEALGFVVATPATVTRSINVKPCAAINTKAHFKVPAFCTVDGAKLFHQLCTADAFYGLHVDRIETHVKTAASPLYALIYLWRTEYGHCLDRTYCGHNLISDQFQRRHHMRPQMLWGNFKWLGTAPPILGVTAQQLVQWNDTAYALYVKIALHVCCIGFVGIFLLPLRKTGLVCATDIARR
jgi:hypothetical protein